MKDPPAMSTRPQPHESGKRQCLKCSEMFHSKNAGNRICKKCARVNAAIRISEEQLACERGAKRLNGLSISECGTYEMDFY